MIYIRVFYPQRVHSARQHICQLIFGIYGVQAGWQIIFPRRPLFIYLSLPQGPIRADILTWFHHSVQHPPALPEIYLLAVFSNILWNLKSTDMPVRPTSTRNFLLNRNESTIMYILHQFFSSRRNLVFNFLYYKGIARFGNYAMNCSAMLLYCLCQPLHRVCLAAIPSPQTSSSTPPPPPTPLIAPSRNKVQGTKSRR